MLPSGGRWGRGRRREAAERGGVRAACAPVALGLVLRVPQLAGLPARPPRRRLRRAALRRRPPSRPRAAATGLPTAGGGRRCCLLQPLLPLRSGAGPHSHRRAGAPRRRSRPHPGLAGSGGQIGLRAQGGLRQRHRDQRQRRPQGDGAAGR